ncbi:glycosyltransferase family 39 protein [Candidatus Gottesmanbacteria bacterium]|nr:glycosyltransferase family 39 protein [Candidatus Gottesmanbacteria bacterium]
MIIPLVITAIGAMFRFTNLNWDMGGRIHPDEGLIVNGVLAIKAFSRLFPGFHDYNGFSVYLLKASTLVASALTRSGYWSTSAEGVTLVGRFLSATLATVSILLVYYLAKRLWNKEVGYMAALLFACTPLVIQLAHFYTTESIMVFLLLTLSLAGISYVRNPSVYTLFPMAVSMGLLLATKSTAYLFLPIPIGCTVLARTRRSWVFMLLLGVLIKTRKEPLQQLFAVWSVAFLVFIVSAYLKFIRYSAPIAPFVALFGAKVLFDLKKIIPGKIFVWGIIFVQVIWAFMVYHMYLVPHPSLQAASWIAKYVQDRSVVLTEQWNSIIRFDLPPLSTKQFTFVSFNAYADDTTEKISDLNNITKRADYVILESPKVKNTITRLSERWPQTSGWYRDLTSGNLGFVKVAEFASYPQLGPLVINDELAEETWYVFDHPTVRIYAKKEACSAQMVCP